MLAYLVNLAWRAGCHAWRWACGVHARRAAHHSGAQPRPPPRAAPIARPSHMTQPPAHTSRQGLHRDEIPQPRAHRSSPYPIFRPYSHICASFDTYVRSEPSRATDQWTAHCLRRVWHVWEREISYISTYQSHTCRSCRRLVDSVKVKSQSFLVGLGKYLLPCITNHRAAWWHAAW